MELIVKRLWIICCLFLCQHAVGQELGKMNIQNFFPKEFNGAPQTWDAIQSESGLMYFANTEGVLEYDGTTWRIIRIGNNTSAGALLKDESGKIYVGGSNEIGYLQANNQGKLQYVSINHLIDSVHATFASIRWIHQLKDKIIYITYKEIFAYSRTTQSIQVLSAPSDLRGSFILQDQLYIKDTQEGLLIWDGKTDWQKAPHYQQSHQFDFTTALPYGENRALIGTTSGLLIYSPFGNAENAFKSIPLEDVDLVKKFQLYALAYSPKNEIVMGLTGAGVLIVDHQGKTLKHISKQNGLFSETTLDVFYDKQSALWIPTGDCISRVEVNEPITYWNSQDGLEGIVIDAQRYRDLLYITTLNTAYRLEGNQIKRIKGMAYEQHWNMLHFQTSTSDLLLMGSEQGIWEFNGHNQRKLIKEGRHAVSLYQLKSNPNRVIVGWNDGLLSLRYQQGTWIDEGLIENFEDDIRSIFEDDDGTIWLGTFRHGIAKVVPSENWQKPTQIKFYQEDEGIPSLKNAMVYAYRDELLVASEKGFLSYNPTTDRFEPDCRFGERFCNGNKDVYGFAELEDGNLMITGVITKNSVPGIITMTNGQGSWFAEPFQKVPEMFAISIYHEPNGVSWLCGSEGLFRYDGKMTKTYHADYPTLIRKVNLGEDSTVFWGESSAPLPILPYKNNSLTFFYSSPDFESQGKTEYQHWLVGYENGWSHWAKDTKKEYTNLTEGDYIYQVRAKNIYGKETAVAAFPFSIAPPWYRTIWAYLLYALGIVVFTIIIVRFNAKRLQRDKARLSELVSARTAELESQKEEIKSQAESLQKANVQINAQKDQLEKAYQSIRLLSELGQQLNSTFDIEKLLAYIHEYVGKFMDTTVFAVGILEKDERLFYQLAIENGVRLKPFYRKLKEKNQFAVWCLKNKEPIIIHDVKSEYHPYIESFSHEATKTVHGQQLNSLIFYPLLIHDVALGVMTVQSNREQAYSQTELDVLSNLASYVATSLNNAKAYHIIEDKNEDITASIRYAKTIQQAILPSRETFKQSFEEFFIFYRPKDIVSGDFYWLAHIDPEEEKWRGEITFPMTFVAVVDCTGHGVPGAFMSMIGNTLLNEIIIQNHIIAPDQILERLDAQVKEVLHQDENANNDGMEVGFCSIEYLNDGAFNVRFTGAKRPFYYWEQKTNKLIQIEGCRRAIGGLFSNGQPFETFQIQLQKGDVFYLTSDGLADQNRLGSTRKFGSKRIRQFFQKFSALPMPSIDAKLNETYDVFTKGSDQRDDITIIGIRL